MIPEIGHCPWVSIIPLNVMEQEKEKVILSIYRMYVLVTERAIENYVDGKFLELDAHAANNGCEVHTFNMLNLACSHKLKDECIIMIDTCKKITGWIENNIELIKVEKPIQEWKKCFEKDVMISTEMDYLIQSQLLSLIKEVKHYETKFKDRKYEEFFTRAHFLRILCKNQLLCNKEKLGEIVAEAQSRMSLGSISFMRAQLVKSIFAQEKEWVLVMKMLEDVNLLPISEEHKPVKWYSCQYYNTKALLFLLAELKVPLVIKKTMTKEMIAKEGNVLVPFNSLGTFGEFEPMEAQEIADAKPVVICQAYLPAAMSIKDWLEKVRSHGGLGNMILASASQGGQYKPIKLTLCPPDMDSEAKEEIRLQVDKTKGVESLIDVDHYYVTTWKYRNDVFKGVNNE